MNQDIFEHIQRSEDSVNTLFSMTQRLRTERNIKRADVLNWFFQRMYTFQRMNSAILRGLEDFSVSFPSVIQNLDMSSAGFYETQLQMFLEMLSDKFQSFPQVSVYEMDIVRTRETFATSIFEVLQNDLGFLGLPYIPNTTSLEFEEDDLFQIRTVLLNRYALRIFVAQLRIWEAGSLDGLLEIWDIPDLDRLLKSIIQRSPEIAAYAGYLSTEFAYQWNISSLMIPQEIAASRQNMVNLVQPILDSFSISFTSPSLPWQDTSFIGI